MSYASRYILVIEAAQLCLPHPVVGSLIPAVVRYPRQYRFSNAPFHKHNKGTVAPQCPIVSLALITWFAVPSKSLFYNVQTLPSGRDDPQHPDAALRDKDIAAIVDVQTFRDHSSFKTFLKTCLLLQFASSLLQAQLVILEF